MYAGHFAAGLAIRSREPRAPLWALLVGAAWVDLLHGLLVLAGIEHVRANPAVFLGFDLVYMPWTHSLAAGIVWGGLGAAIFARQGKGVALAIFAAVLSHFVLDFPMHLGDLRLAPGIDTPLGLGLWAHPYLAWIFEAAVIAGGAFLWARAARVEGVPAARIRAVVALVALLHVSFLPALNPLGLIARTLG